MSKLKELFGIGTAVFILGGAHDADAGRRNADIINASFEGGASGIVIDHLTNVRDGLGFTRDTEGLYLPQRIAFAQVNPPVPDILPTPDSLHTQAAKTEKQDFNFRELPTRSGRSLGTPDSLNLTNFAVYGYVPENNSEGEEIYRWYYLRLPTGQNAWIRNDGITVSGEETVPDISKASDYLNKTRIYKPDGTQVMNGLATINVDAVQSFMDSLIDGGYPAETLDPGVLDMYVTDDPEQYYTFKLTRNTGIHPEGSVYVVRITEEGQYGGAIFISTGEEFTEILEELEYPTEVDITPPNHEGVMLVNRRGVSMAVDSLFGGDSYEDAFSYDPLLEEEANEASTEPSIIVWDIFNDVPDGLVPETPVNWDQPSQFVFEDGTRIPYGPLGWVRQGPYYFVVVVAQVTDCQSLLRGSRMCGLVMPHGNNPNSSVVILPYFGWGNDRDISSILVTPTPGGLSLLAGSTEAMSLNSLGFPFENITDADRADYFQTLRPGQDIMFGLRNTLGHGRNIQALLDGILEPTPGIPGDRFKEYIPDIILFR